MTEIEKLIFETNQLSKKNAEDIKEIKQKQKEQTELITSIKILTNEVKHMREDVSSLKETHEKDKSSLADRLQEIEAKPAKRWDSMIDKIIMLVVGALVGYVLKNVGL